MFPNLQSLENPERSIEILMNRIEGMQRVTLGVACCVCVALGTAGYRAMRVYGGQHFAAQIPLKSAKTRPPVETGATRGTTARSWADGVGDGTPDFLRLDDAADQEAFRGWFALIAEFQGLRPPSDVPPEISDCAALLRYTYRYTLRAHDQAWIEETGIEPESAPAAIKKYHYPFTPLGADLLRIRPGPAVPDDVRSGAFAEFADAKTLKKFNTFFVSRDVRDARPGDILFYRQSEQNEPFHSMIYVGESRWLADASEDWTAAVIVYHTGEPGSAGMGMRRVTLAGLLRYPSPRWRPLAGNANFLGIYRWNILRGAG
jgi:uncharacterized protein YfaT (DUF1175 family)